MVTTRDCRVCAYTVYNPTKKPNLCVEHPISFPTYYHILPLILQQKGVCTTNLLLPPNWKMQLKLWIRGTFLQRGGPFRLEELCTDSTAAPTVGRPKSLLTRKAGRGHATPHMPVETSKCWWILKIEPSIPKPAQTPSKMGQNLYITHQRTREFLYTASRSTQTAQMPLPPAHAFGSIFSNHQHFAVSTPLHRSMRFQGHILNQCAHLHRGH